MKNLIVLLGLFLMTFSLQAQVDCECDFDPEADWICAVDQDGNIVPVPNECFAECLELTLSDEECDFDFPGGEWEDCDCEEDSDEEWICVLTDVENGLTCPFPNLCFAECAGYSADDVVEDGCEDWDWDAPIGGGFGDCDCEEDEFGEGICIEVAYEGETFQMWVPSECHADCWEVGEYTVVECEDWDGGWTDCECEEDETGEGICIEVNYDGELYTEWVPSECFAECWGITEYTVVECEDWDGGWTDCECEEDETGEGICIEVSYEGEAFQMWVPSECHADCWEVGEYIVVECDDWDGGDWPDGDWGDWSDCDCEISDLDETVCVLTDVETGAICPFPNMCFAECLGYTADDVVECDDTWIWNDDTEFPDGGFDCEDCFEDEGETVCVTLEGQIFELPNACFAECLGLDVVDCSDLDGGTPPVVDMDRQTPNGVQIFFAGNGNVAYTVADNSNNDSFNGNINVFPNPVNDVLNVQLDMVQDAKATINVIDNTGRVISTNNVNLTKGFNTTNINTSKYAGGIYHLQILTNDEVITSKFVKL